jgi:cytochrome c oxidase subunit 2
MQMKKSGEGSTATAVFFALFLVALVVITVYVFVARLYPAPPAITGIGNEIDQQYGRTLLVTGVVFILSQLGLAWVIFRYRDHGQRVSFTRGNDKLELAWTTATIVLFLGLGVMARHAWAQVRFTASPPDAIQVEVTGKQFFWYFRYPGRDGVFGRVDPYQRNLDSSSNPVYLDPKDPAGNDDVVVTELYVPVNHDINLLIRGQDVIHSFFVRELRIKQDAVPGMVIPLHFTPTQIGQYEIICTQLCGLGHYRMHSMMHVVSETDYESWLHQQEGPAPQAATPSQAPAGQ